MCHSLLLIYTCLLLSSLYLSYHRKNTVSSGRVQGRACVRSKLGSFFVTCFLLYFPGFFRVSLYTCDLSSGLIHASIDHGFYLYRVGSYNDQGSMYNSTGCMLYSLYSMWQMMTIDLYIVYVVSIVCVVYSSRVSCVTRQPAPCIYPCIIFYVCSIVPYT